MSHKVEATATGYYDVLRQRGDKFSIVKVEHFSQAWMKWVGKPPKKRTKPVKVAGKKSAAKAPDLETLKMPELKKLAAKAGITIPFGSTSKAVVDLLRETE